MIQKSGIQRKAAELGVAIIAPDTSPRGLDTPGTSRSLSHEKAQLKVNLVFFASEAEERKPSLVAAPPLLWYISGKVSQMTFPY